MESLPNQPIKRWTAKRRSALVLSILQGDTSVQEAARKHGLTVAEVEDWRDRFLAGAEDNLRSRPRDEEAMRREVVKQLQRKVGELVMDNDILKAALEVKGIRSQGMIDHSDLPLNSDE